MKVFCTVLLFVASTAMAHKFLPDGVTPESLFKQTCISWEKVIKKASEGPGCGKLANANPKSSADIAAKIPKLLKGYKCFTEGTGIISDDVSNISKLIEVIKEVAVTPEAATAIEDTIKSCTKGAETVNKNQRNEMIKCGIADLVKKGTCTPKE